MDKTEADGVTKVIGKTPQEAHLRKRVRTLKKALATTNGEKIRLKEICEDQEKQLAEASRETIWFKKQYDHNKKANETDVDDAWKAGFQRSSDEMVLLVTAFERV